MLKTKYPIWFRSLRNSTRKRCTHRKIKIYS